MSAAIQKSMELAILIPGSQDGNAEVFNSEKRIGFGEVSGQPNNLWVILKEILPLFGS
jgi:hypothetical protein